uniref:RNA-directed DNA polymerase n=1 Tax=Trichogramma kaykai TaxID=54128 RepID=A0ABD2WU91_9HYME
MNQDSQQQKAEESLSEFEKSLLGNRADPFLSKSKLNRSIDQPIQVPPGNNDGNNSNLKRAGAFSNLLQIDDTVKVDSTDEKTYEETAEDTSNLSINFQDAKSSTILLNPKAEGFPDGETTTKENSQEGTLTPPLNPTTIVDPINQTVPPTPTDTVERKVATMTDKYVKLKDALATIPIFDQTTSGLEDFLELVDYAFGLIDPAEEKSFAKLILSKVGPEARKSLKSIAIDKVNEFKKQLRDLYSTGLSVSSLQGLLAQQYQQHGESVLNFANRVRSLGDQILQIKGITSPDHEFAKDITASQIEVFKKGLMENISLRLTKHDKFNELVKEAIRIEKELEVTRLMRGKLEKRCGNCNRAGHSTNECRSRRVHATLSTTPSPRENDNHQRPGRLTCNYCKKHGHSEERCHKRAYDILNKQTEEQTTAATNHVTATCTKCDSGSEVNVVTPSAIPSGATACENFTCSLKGVDSKEVTTIGSVEFKINNIPVEFLIVSNDFPINFDGIFGAEFLLTNKTIIDYGKESMRIDDKACKMYFENNPLSQTCSTTVSNFRITHCSRFIPFIQIDMFNLETLFLLDTGAQMSLISIKVLPSDAPIDRQNLMNIEGIERNPKPSLGRVRLNLFDMDVYFQVIDDSFQIPGSGILGSNFLHQGKAILNFDELTLTANEITTPLKVTMRKLESPEDDVYDTIKPTEIDYDLYSDPEDFVALEPTDHIPESRIFTIQREDLKDLIKVDHLNDTEAQYVHTLIHDHKDIFHIPGETLPGTSKVQHRIITTDDDPINVKQYKYPHALKEEVNKQVQEMLDSDVIERSDSPYNNPLWIVEKKPDSEGNKRWRIVLDFRALNDKTISDAYPLPNITEIFDQVGSAKYYSVLDLAWGFWQIRLDPRDAHKCAFSTPFGHYQFIRMPFGLKNAPATFQRLMDTKGKSNVNADSLSRNIPEESNNEALCVVTRSKDKAIAGKENLESTPTPPVPKRGRPPKHLQKPKPAPPPRDTDKRQTKQTEKYDPSPIPRIPEPDPRTFNTPQSDSEDSPESEQESSEEEDQSPPEITPIQPENIPTEPSQIENQSPPEQVSAENTTKSTIDIVYSKDLMHCVTGNIVYFIDTNGKPIDAGATKLHEFHKLPTFTDLSVGDVLIHNTKQGKNHFALCLKDESPLAPSTCKANLEALFSTLKELLKKKKVEKLFVTKTEHLFGLQWTDIIDLMANILEGHQLKLIICTGNLTYVLPEQRDEIFAELHNSAIGGHRGVSKTYNRIKRKYHWENLKNDVHRRIQQCLDCQLKKLVRLKTRQPMIITDTPGIPFEKIALDIVGPKVILTDQGSNFMSSLMSRMAKRFKIKQIKTTAYHPQSNGSLERSHHVLKEFIKQYTVSDDDWSDWVDLAVLNYNTSVQESTKLTPYEIIFGRLANLPSAQPLRENDLLPTYQGYMKDLVARLNGLQKIAYDNLVASKFRNKKYYDRKLNQQEFKPGDYIFLLRNQAGKKDETYSGPFKMEKLLVLLLITTVMGINNLYLNENLDHSPGIYFEKEDNIRYYSTSWDIVVFIDTAKLTQSMPDMIRTLTKIRETCKDKDMCFKTLHRVNFLTDRLDQLITHFSQTVEALKYVEPLPPVDELRNIRKRAVPLGFIGSVSKYLFGTLSEEDGERYNAQIKELTQKQLDLAKIARDDAHLVHNKLNNLEHRINDNNMPKVYTKRHQRRKLKLAVSSSMSSVYENFQSLKRRENDSFALRSVETNRNESNSVETNCNESNSVETNCEESKSVDNNELQYVNETNINVTINRNDTDCMSHIENCYNDFDDISLHDNDNNDEYRYSSCDSDYSDDEWMDDCHYNDSMIIDKPDFKSEIRTWAVEERIAHSSLSKLLKILNVRIPSEKFPRDSRTLLRTPKNIEIQQRAGGEYHHFGLKKVIINIISKRSLLGNENTLIKLYVASDGAPTGNSSEKNMWPILCSEHTDYDVENNTVYPIGIYHGVGKPTCMNEFFTPFVEEAIHFVNNGCEHENISYQIRIFGLIFDAPAKAMALCIAYPNGYYSCTKCEIEGDYIDRVCYPYDKNIVLRTDEKFKDKQYSGSYQKSVTPLNDIPFLGLVSGVPIDYMHLVCLGIVKKLLIFWCFQPNQFKLSLDDRTKISNELITFRMYLPKELARAPRTLSSCKKWKATEYRQFLLYTGPIVLSEKILGKDKYLNFLALHIAITILASPKYSQNESYLNYADQLLHYFVESFGKCYGTNFISYNVHNLLHLVADVRRFGCLDKFSAFKFENCIFLMKRMIRKYEKPLQQIACRFAEKEYCAFESSRTKKYDSRCKVFLKKHSNGPLLRQGYSAQYKILHFNNFVIDVDDLRNNALIINGKFIQALNFVEKDGKNYVIGKELIPEDDIYSSPCKSSQLLSSVVKLSNDMISLRCDKIEAKLCKIICNEKIQTMSSNFYIIDFKDGVSIVPDNWLHDDKKKSSWPKYKFQAQIDNSIKIRESVKPNWKVVEISEILDSAETYEDAEKRLKKISETETEDNSQTIVNPTIIVNRSKKRSTGSNSNIPDFEEPPKKAAKKNKSSTLTPPSLNLSAHDEESQSPLLSNTDSDSTYTRIVKQKKNVGKVKESKTKPGVKDNERVTEMIVSSPESTTNESIVKPNATNSLEKALKKDTGLVPNSPDSIKSNSLSNRIQKNDFACVALGNKIFPESVADSNLMIISYLQELISINNKTYSRVESLENSLRNTQRIGMSSQSNTNWSFLPLKTEDSLKELEKKVKENTNFPVEFSEMLQRVGGSDDRSKINAMMNKVFSDEVGNLYSWKGQKGKKALEDLKVGKIMLDAMLKCREAYTEIQIIGQIRNWLSARKAKLGPKKEKKKRRSQENVSKSSENEEEDVD